MCMNWQRKVWKNPAIPAKLCSGDTMQFDQTTIRRVFYARIASLFYFWGENKSLPPNTPHFKSISFFKTALIAGIAGALWLVCLVATAETLGPKQSTFIKQMVPIIRTANREVLNERQKLLQLHQQWQSNPTLSAAQQQWLSKLADRYKTTSPTTETEWQALIAQVDTMPVSLVLAQAINESAWGKSRFAREGNNYFGRWCYKTGCGIVPLKRTSGASHEVKKFPTELASVEDYLQNINSHTAYQDLRARRQKLEQQGKAVHGVDMADSLTKYSTRGKAYVADIKAIIKKYDLAQFD